MKQRLFEFAILLHSVTGTKILVEKTTFLAKDEKSVGLYAAKQIPDEYNDDLDSIEIIVRAF